jgi:hypothetical protein
MGFMMGGNVIRAILVPIGLRIVYAGLNGTRLNAFPRDFRPIPSKNRHPNNGMADIPWKTLPKMHAGWLKKSPTLPLRGVLRFSGKIPDANRDVRHALAFALGLGGSQERALGMREEIVDLILQLGFDDRRSRAAAIRENLDAFSHGKSP